MDKKTFLDLDQAAQVEYLNELLAEGKTRDEILDVIGIDKVEMGANGLYLVGGKWMGKPMRGYGTAKRSGNEATKFEGAKVIEKGKGAVL